MVRVLVVTCAHRGGDARIVHRQSRSLVEAGHEVTIIAPRPLDATADPPGLRRVDVPRAVGRRRVKSWWACRRAVRQYSKFHDLVLVHDPELLPVLVRSARSLPTVWDVHEDFVAAVSDRRWIPERLRPVFRWATRAIERWAVRGCHVILAEEAYGERFPGAPVVPNSTWVPERLAPPDGGARPRVIHVGRLSRGRGFDELLETGRRLRDRVDVVLIGDADADVLGDLRDAITAGAVQWKGYLANPEALGYVDGAFAGLSLLHDEANYVHSRPTKLIEYMAHGVPVITTPLPLAAALVGESGGGEVVDYFDVDGCVNTIIFWLEHPSERDQAAFFGHAFVANRYNWSNDGERFVDLINSWTSAP